MLNVIYAMCMYVCVSTLNENKTKCPISRLYVVCVLPIGRDKQNGRGKIHGLNKEMLLAQNMVKMVRFVANYKFLPKLYLFFRSSPPKNGNDTCNVLMIDIFNIFRYIKWYVWTCCLYMRERISVCVLIGI